MSRFRENRKQIMEGFIKIFPRIYNHEYQKRVWIRGEGPECDDFDDTACDFLGECDAILENYRDFGITQKQHHLLLKFRYAFKKFSAEHDSENEFIDTPEWAKIMNMAKEVSKAFNACN